METEIRVNLAASLDSTATDLAEVASSLAAFGTDDEIELQARILDRIAEDATEGAAILRALIARRGRVHGLLTRKVPRDTANLQPVPPGPGGGAA
jgi:hypothetical protein